MKKLLSIVIFVLFGVLRVCADVSGSATIYAYAVCDDDGDGKYSLGGGTVQATAEECIPTGKLYPPYKNQTNSGEISTYSTAFGCGFQGLTDIGTSGYYIQASRKSTNTNYIFEGWYNGTKKDDEITLSTSTPLATSDTYKKEYSVGTGTDVHAFAKFSKILHSSQGTEMSWLMPYENNHVIEIRLYSAGDVTVSAPKNQSGTTGAIKAEATESGTGTMKLTLSPLNEFVADGDKYTIQLTSTAGGNLTLTITIDNHIDVTLVRPTVGEGCIEATPYSGGFTESVCYNSASDNVIRFRDVDDFDHQLVAIPAEGYEFLRWKINGVYVSKLKEYRYTLKKDDQITAEFVPDGTAIFVVGRSANNTFQSSGNEYFSLKEAIEYANSSDNKTIAVQRSGILYNKDFETVDGKKVITIPSGVTLLVPGDAKYTITTQLREIDMVAFSGTPSLYRQLTLPSNTRIVANGNICVYAPLSSSVGHNGKPQTYGQIDMESGTEIELNNGAILTVFGYITGVPTNSRVLAKSGSTVYEGFQMPDWVGGTNALDLIDNTQRVFPINQYYVQNIETKLTLQYGAMEYVSAPVAVNGTVSFVTIDAKIPLNMELVAKDNNSSEDKGFFCLGDGAEMSKWYNGAEDKQMYEVNCMKGYNTATAKCGIVYGKLQVSVINSELNSANYILPFTNNMDVTICKGITLTNSMEMLLLPGAKVTIEEGATYHSKAKLIVYDKEWNVGFYGPSHLKLIPIQYTAFHSAAPGKRTENTLTDATMVINGILSIDNPAFFTTIGGTYSSTTINDNDCGANIISEKSGKVKFASVGGQTTTYQKAADYISIPINNARLRNADGSWSAGEMASVNDEYIYSPSKGKWVKPTEGLSFGQETNNTFYLRLPQEYIEQSVLLPVITEEVLEITDFDITWPQDNQYFAKAGDAIYENNALIMPIRYTVTGVHNKDVTPNAYTGSIKVTYIGSDKTEHTEEVTITLSAIEDYTPKFTVKIIDDDETIDVATNNRYTFPSTIAQNSSTAQVVITPDLATTAKLLSAQDWDVSAIDNPPFAAALGEGEQFLSHASVSFTPQAGQKYEGSLTIKATYKDADKVEIPSATTSVVLNGEGALQPNLLKFDPNIAKTIIQGGAPIKKTFSNLGSGIDKITSITCTYANGTPASALVTITKEDGNYTLTALEPNNPAITDVREVTITVHQNPSAIMAGTGEKPVTLTVTILPPAVWNWSDLYYGETYTNQPVKPSKEGPWKLELTTNPNGLLAFSGESPNYHVQVGNGDVGMVYEAEFTFTQGDYVKVFTSRLQADPRTLGYCVEYTRQFTNVSTGNSTVTFAEGHDATPPTTTFRPADIWEIMMIGIPDKLTFTASGEKIWYISESSTGAANSYTPIVSGETLSGEQVLQLSPTTNYVKFEYGAGTGNNGTISNLCISALELASAQDMVYFPIYKNGEKTSKEIVIKHSKENIDVTIQEDNSGLAIVKSEPVVTPTADDGEAYYQTTVTLSGDKTNVFEGTYTLNVAQHGTEPIKVQIHADEVPQGLPIHLETDDVHRYHFIALPEQSYHTRWDAATKSIIFQDPGSGYKTRSVMLTFEGAPSRMSFTSPVVTGWTIAESATGAADSFTPCVVTIDGDKLSYSLHYTTRYVRINYLSPGREVVPLSNLVIEGEPILIVTPEELEFSDEEKVKTLTLTTINLNKIRIELDNNTDFQITHEKEDDVSHEYTLDGNLYPNALGINKMDDIQITTTWKSDNMANEGLITIYHVLEDNSEVILAKVQLVAAGRYLRLDNAAKTGIYTGIPDGTRDTDGDGEPNVDYKYTYHGKDYTDYTYHEVNLTNAFASDGTALFDYLFVFGETTTNPEKVGGKDVGGKDITAPIGENGSNALTPYYVYERATDVNGNYDRYRHVTTILDANVGEKAVIPGIIFSLDEPTKDELDQDEIVDVKYIHVGQSKSIYITGFAPYATTGWTKGDEGVFFFRGNAGSKLDIYLEDAHIFARNKMQNGQPFYERGSEMHKLHNPKFSEKYARGSGGVLVFECIDKFEHIDVAIPFEVSIHTIGNNLLKSNYGCFNYFFGLDPYQISAPIHVRLHSADHVRLSKTTLNFDDIWPTKLDETGQITESKRTNGFLGLKKLNNNAPSIDLGNPYTTVNFNGGQVQLQNAQIVSTNYKTTLAISYRSGEYGGDKVGLKFAYGIGTDSVGGTVNFNDGTITIEPMWVKEEYKNYYFIDKDADGNEKRRRVGTANGIDIYEYQTSCLRCPKNTYVYGGSICWLRACQHVTSKGGAPIGGNGIDLGQYVYTFNPEQGDEMNDKHLVTKIQFPNNVLDKSGNSVASYFNTYYPNNRYGISSITPDENGKLYFWIPDGYGNVSAEKDKFLTTWKACMTEISAGMSGIKGTVGGDTPIERNEEIKYMLYCQINEDISQVIRTGTEDGDNNYTYKAPVKVPPVAQGLYGTYTYIPPISVSEELQHKVTSEKAYEVTDKVYYITTATADVWQTFTAPFDVAKIWVVETYSEKVLENIANTNGREVALLAQAEHNADFAAFFGVAMAIGTKDPLETIFNDFVAWGKEYDQQTTDKYDQSKEAVYNSTSDGDYTLRDRYQLIPYNGSNWNKANFYLNHNAADWEIDDADENGDPKFKVHWELPNVDDDGIPQNGVLMRKGETYSMLFPYCTGCWKTDPDGEGVLERDFWDYWSGKFLIFESVDYSKESDKVHIIEGSDYIKEDWTAAELETIKPDGIFVKNLPAEGKAKVTGNSTFAYLDTEREDILTYFPDAAAEAFLPGSGETIYPTSSFLLAPSIPLSMHNMPARGVMRSGQIIYDQPDDDDTNGNQNDTSGGHMPTVGGGNDLFITSIAGGINVAVAAPQNIRVLSSTGAVIYNGFVQTAVDITLPANGIYIVSGENEVQKILF